VIQRRAAVLISALALSACASVGERGFAPGGETISGRLSVRVDATASTPSSAVSGNFELSGTPAAGRLNLSSPLGTVMAQASWSPGRAVLVTPQGESSYPDLDGLTLAMLGERLPVAALFDWLKGRPWSGAPSALNQPPADKGFQQLGWQVSLMRLAEGWISAERAPSQGAFEAPRVLVRAQVERP
jgi:outer membrane lipoprotein LolB